jgi:hypothetical protein
VITVERGRFAVSVKPALTQTERQARSFFVTAEKARQFARRMSIKRPRLFQLIVDDLPKPRPTLDEIMGLAPAGRDGTA